MKLTLLALSAAISLAAADPAGFALWTAGDLKKIEKKLESETEAGRFKSETLEKFGNHYTMMAHRTGNGGAELHETEADLFVIETGTARLVVGGQIVDPKTTAPHEIRGAKIEGGVEKTLGPGDIVHIPAGSPHQLFPTSPRFTYFVVKVGGQ